jgi:DNA repair exonuclease SbcCD ATPase subunit
MVTQSSTNGKGSGKEALRRAIVRRGPSFGLGAGKVEEAEVIDVNGENVPQIATKPEDGLREEIEVLKRNVADLTTRLADADKSKDRIQKELSKRIQELTNINLSLDAAKKELNAQKADLQKMNGEQKVRVGELEDKVANLETQLLAKVGEVSTLNTKISGLESDRKLLSSRITELEGQVAGLQSSIGVKSDRIEVGKKLLRSVRAEIATLKKDLKKSGAEISDLMKKLGDVQNIEEGLRGDIIAIETQWYADIRRKKELEERLRGSNVERLNAQRKSWGLREELGDLNKRYQASLDLIKELQEEVQKKKSQMGVGGHLWVIAQLRDSLRSIQKEIESGKEKSRREVINLKRKMVVLENSVRTQLVTIERLSNSIIAMRQENQNLNNKLELLKKAAEELLRIKDDWKGVGSGREMLDARAKIGSGPAVSVITDITTDTQGVLSPEKVREILNGLQRVETPVAESKIPKIQAEEEKDLEAVEFRKKIQQAEVFADVFRILDEIYPVTSPLTIRKRYQEVIQKIKEIRLVAEKESNTETRNNKIFTFNIPGDKYGITEKVRELLGKVNLKASPEIPKIDNDTVNILRLTAALNGNSISKTKIRSILAAQINKGKNIGPVELLLGQVMEFFAIHMKAVRVTE